MTTNITNSITIVQSKSDLPSQMPTSIRIGAFDYDVEELPVMESERYNLGGDFDHNNLLIRVMGESWKRQKRADIVLHEVMHGIYQNYGLTDEAKEEEIVIKMTNGMLQVMRDNPDLMAFIFDSFEGPESA